MPLGWLSHLDLCFLSKKITGLHSFSFLNCPILAHYSIHISLCFGSSASSELTSPPPLPPPSPPLSASLPLSPLSSHKAAHFRVAEPPRHSGHSLGLPLGIWGLPFLKATLQPSCFFFCSEHISVCH